MIDAHVHFWSAGFETNIRACSLVPALRRDFGPDEYLKSMRTSGIRRAIAVQAEPSIAHTHSLLNISETFQEIEAVIGWVDLMSPDALKVLRNLSTRPSFKGVRVMLARHNDPAVFMQQPAREIFAWMEDTGLVLELQASYTQIEYALALNKLHPELKLVLTGSALPWPVEWNASDWRRSIENLAENTNKNLYCKLSGFLESKDGASTAFAIEEMGKIVVDAFGSLRLMAGANWPIYSLYSDYAGYWHSLRNLLVLSELTQHEIQQVIELNAVHVYGLSLAGKITTSNTVKK